MLTYIRRFNFETDYAIMQAWWRAHDSFAPKPEHLTQDGYVLMVQDEPVGVFFMYPMGTSKICYLGFPTISVRCRDDLRDEVFKAMFNAAKTWAEQREMALVYISINKANMINRMKDYGFVKADKHSSHMFLEVK